MQVILREADQRCTAIELPAGATCAQLHAAARALTGAECALVRDGRLLPDAATALWGAGVVEAAPRVCGGAPGARGQLDPAFQALADQYNVQMLVCRKCYARIHPKAKTCRKRKCGRCADLRPKKVSTR